MRRETKNFGGYESEEFVARFYDYVPGYTNRADLDFYLKLARQAQGRILELGCGTGRLLIPLAEAGVEVTGLDLSNYMLERCREKLGLLPSAVRDRIEIVNGSMVDFQLDSKFGLIICPFRAFQHIVNVSDQLSCLQSAHSHLEDQARLVLDFFNVSPLRTFSEKFQVESEDFSGIELPDGTQLRRTHRIAAYHRAEQCNDIEFTYYVTDQEGKTESFVQSFPMRYFYPFELEHLLARCGFQVSQMLGDYNRSRYSDDSSELIVVATKC